ncbi:MAG: hypothetical protein CMQ21_02305 [Gammaproteobacteria bacterium]|nr:hypothetical protein [Gammaproteobacteria bacterium]
MPSITLKMVSSLRGRIQCARSNRRLIYLDERALLAGGFDQGCDWGRPRESFGRNGLQGN